MFYGLHNFCYNSFNCCLCPRWGALPYFSVLAIIVRQKVMDIQAVVTKTKGDGKPFWGHLFWWQIVQKEDFHHIVLSFPAASQGQM